MKNIIIMMIITILLTACSTNVDHKEKTFNHKDSNDNTFYAEVELEDFEDEEEELVLGISDDIKQLKEFGTIDNEIDLDKHQIDIIEDNFSKRIMIITDANAEDVYKTIFTKKTNRLKIIDIHKGQIFNQTIS